MVVSPLPSPVRRHPVYPSQCPRQYHVVLLVSASVFTARGSLAKTYLTRYHEQRCFGGVTACSVFASSPVAREREGKRERGKEKEREREAGKGGAEEIKGERKKERERKREKERERERHLIAHFG